MQRFIPRDPFESDKRAGPNWWLEKECGSCIYVVSDVCKNCPYNEKKKRTVYPTFD